MDGKCVLDGVEKKFKQILVWYFIKKTDTWKTKEMEYNIKMDLLVVGCDGVRWL